MTMVLNLSFFNKIYRNQIIKIASITIISTLSLTLPIRYLHAQTPDSGASITIRSDSQEADSETGVITARGNVQISYPARQIQATSSQAQYYSRDRRLVLTGNVYVIQEGNSMRAETMTYLIDERKFIATPKSNRQVESTYLVTESSSTSN